MAALPFGPVTTEGVSRSGSVSADANAVAYEDRSAKSSGSMAIIQHGDRFVTVEDCLRGGSLSSQDRPVGDLAVPLDQRRNRSASSNNDFEQFPQRVCDRAVGTVVEKQVPLVAGLFRMACVV